MNTKDENHTNELELLKKLFKRVKKTTRCRYHASRRLMRHHRFSQWTIALLSTGLIFIPLIQIFKATFEIPINQLNVLQTILAILVLVFSLLLGQENFFSKSKDMHRNGVELGRLDRKIEGFIEKNKTKKEQLQLYRYEELTNEYYDILDKYENHEPIDFENAKLNVKNENDVTNYWCIKIKIFIQCLFIFSLYLIPCSMILILFILYIYKVTFYQ